MRRKGKTKTLIVFVQDIIFWLIAMFIIIMSAFMTNNGELRGFMFVGYIIGAIFYLTLFSKMLLKTFGIILDFFENLFKIPSKFLKKFADKIKFKKKNVNF